VRKFLLALTVTLILAAALAYSDTPMSPLYPKFKVKVAKPGEGKSRVKLRLPTPDLSKPNKWAVVIGIADYEGAESDLWHPDEDAREMYRALVKEYGFARDHVVLLVNKMATLSVILGAIDWLLAWENETSTVVFFFSGHGYNLDEELTAEYEYPIDENDGVDEAIVSYDRYAILDDLLSMKLSQLEASRVFLCFVSCFSGGMDDVFKALEDGRTVVLVAACGERQFTYDVLYLGNTLFGYYYVDEGILDGEGDGWGPNGVEDGLITVEEAFYYADSYVNSFVEAHGLTESDPEIFDTDEEADLYP